MIEYPRIFSLSTVGVRQHYNQDYLLHRVRTDFTGNNGIGKSLIADLFQLIFIGQKSKINFGTESFKNKDRHIHTLPYKTDDAYVFIHIEFKEGEFITIGTNIGNKRSRPLKSFWILNQAYNENDKKELEALSLNADQLAYSKDFLKDGHFLPIQQLAKHLRNNKKGYLKSFTDLDDKKDYYEFLYKNELIPINLAINENLDAFAKVIQSFSKANSLDTESDKILKDFLFENSLETLQSKYKSNKEKLEKLIDEYNELDEDIKTIELKQKVLGNLKELQLLKDTAQINYLTATYHLNYESYEKVASEYDSTEKKIKDETNKIDILKKALPEVKKEMKSMEEEHQSFSKALKPFNEYKDVLKERSQQLKNLDALQKIELPTIDHSNIYDINIDNYGNDLIIEKIENLNGVIDKYESIENLRSKTQSQIEKIDLYKSEKNKSLDELQTLHRILDAGDEGSLIAQIVKEGNNLTKAQETVLFGLLKKVSWKEPDNPIRDSQFTTDITLIEEANIREDKVNSGYWFKVGKLQTFVPYSEENQIFADTSEMKDAKAKKQIALNNEIASIQAELIEIQKFEQGDSYDSSLIEALKNINKDLKDFSLYESSKEGMSISKKLASKITKDKDSLTASFNVLENLRLQIPILITDEDIDVQLSSFSKQVSSKYSDYQRLESKHKTSKGTIKQKEENLETLGKLLSSLKKDSKETKVKFENSLDSFKKQFSELNIEELELLH
ncbi:hypothetical protein H8K90_01100 [Winogradskyella echinorum]|uniref:DNA repair exonuclease SbcCD ATPase subunit n=1 Tax=Winogradskyella echinorum TaxID=538189 RepID=A0ABR6XWT0_9FLAO|nr:hypothetical protein [Winogradskyella echinorum]MBC3844962.1 hypothetical protein [Winogradskyella echinorum]MBC5749310.1 hypothetical protein [Winogradskyella echinorum]